MNQSQNMSVWLSKMILAQHYFAQFAQAGKRRSKA
jgi:hypothetical protein